MAYTLKIKGAGTTNTAADSFETIQLVYGNGGNSRRCYIDGIGPAGFGTTIAIIDLVAGTIKSSAAFHGKDIMQILDANKCDWTKVLKHFNGAPQTDFSPT